MTLFDDGLDLLEERQIIYADRFIPHFFASYACHSFNRMNRLNEIYWEHDRIPDTRLQLLFVAPPGFSKSFFMKNCFDHKIGILNTKTIPVTFEGTVTEAAWTGSYAKVNGGVKKIIGLAEEYKDGLVAIEEFSAITHVMKQQHSATLEASLNRSLFGGEMSKRLASGPPIKYRTDVTLIAGTQVTRFEIGGGLFRRFNYIFWIPTTEEIAELIKAWRAGTNVQLPRENLMSYRQAVMDWQKSLDNISEIKFTDNVYYWIKEFPHFEQAIFRKLALGYNLFAAPKIPSKFIVDVDDTLKEMLKDSFQWRKDILADPEGSQVLQVLRSHMYEKGEGMSKRKLQGALLKYSMNSETSAIAIARLIGLRYIFFSKGKLEAIGGKKKDETNSPYS